MAEIRPLIHPWVHFSASDVEPAAYARLREGCRRIGFLPTFCHGVLLNVAMTAPEDEAAVAAIRQLTHQEVRRFGISRADLEEAIVQLDEKNRILLLEERPAAGAGSAVRPGSWDFYRHGVRGVAHQLVQFAFAAGASDFLLDEQEEWMDVAIKLAGTKEMLPPVERSFASLLLKAFKEMAGLSTHTVVTGQSGFASVAVGDGRRADLRVEVTPTVHGESLVARVQNRELQLERMQRLPFTEPNQRGLVQSCLHQQQGLIVVTGPTGHGKTTTLYSCLGQLDRSALNIRTLEDPVEFAVPWITQIPVGSGTGRSFSDGLKSLLRQAPNVILMGEIRDQVVAQTCIEAVDTGHLIFATLHARDAIGVISRLLDLGVTGSQLANTLVIAIGQRLVRRLCPGCRRRAVPSRAQARHFEHYRLMPPEYLYLAAGCEQCGHRGEIGLIPIFEIFHPPGHDALAEGIAGASREKYSERMLRERWIDLGGSPLVREGLRLAAVGEVAYAEILKYERNPPSEDPS